MTPAQAQEVKRLSSIVGTRQSHLNSLSQRVYVGGPNVPARTTVEAARQSRDEAISAFYDFVNSLVDHPTARRRIVDTQNVTKVERPSDFSVLVRFTSCRAASQFEREVK